MSGARLATRNDVAADRLGMVGAVPIIAGWLAMPMPEPEPEEPER